MEDKKKKLVAQLIAHFDGDKQRVKAVGNGCKTLDINLSDERTLENIAKAPEAFFTIITMSDFGIISKLQEVKDILNKKD